MAKKKKKVKAVAKKPAKGGPKKWVPTEADLKNIASWYGMGLTKEQCAIKLGISHETLFKRQNDMPEISEAFRKGKADVDNMVISKLYEKIHKEGSERLIMFHAKARMGWRDNDEVKPTTINNNTIVVENMLNASEEDLAKLLKQIPKGVIDDGKEK